MQCHVDTDTAFSTARSLCSSTKHCTCLCLYIRTYVYTYVPLQDYYEDLLSGKTDRHDLVIKKLKERCVCVSFADVVGLITSPSVLHMYVRTYVRTYVAVICTTVNCVFVYVVPVLIPVHTTQCNPSHEVLYSIGRAESCVIYDETYSMPHV